MSTNEGFAVRFPTQYAKSARKEPKWQRPNGGDFKTNNRHGKGTSSTPQGCSKWMGTVSSVWPGKSSASKVWRHRQALRRASTAWAGDGLLRLPPPSLLPSPRPHLQPVSEPAHALKHPPSIALLTYNPPPGPNHESVDLQPLEWKNGEETTGEKNAPCARKIGVGGFGGGKKPKYPPFLPRLVQEWRVFLDFFPVTFLPPPPNIIL